MRGLAIVGCTEIGFQLARNIERAPWSGLRTVGFFDDRPADRRAHVAERRRRVRRQHRRTGATSGRRSRAHDLHHACRCGPRTASRACCSRLADTTASVYLVPDFYVFELLHSRWINVGGLPAVSMFENPFYGVDGMVKRLLDVTVGS